MRKIVYLSLVSTMLFLTSCFKEIDNWYTNTFNYDGRYVVATTCEEYDDDDMTIEDGNELWIYNSAANVANEIIIDTHVSFDDNTEAPFPVKGKFSVTGDPSGFRCGVEAANLYIGSEITDENNYYFFYPDYGFYTPSDWGDADESEVGEEYQAYQLYTRIKLESGKISPKGATTIGGNKADGVEVKLLLSVDEMIIEGYETPKSTWADPDEPEYGWRVKAGSRKNAAGWEETWMLKGYRYTGYPEDNPNIQPPIITK